jgi:hypothetical protein
MSAYGSPSRGSASTSQRERLLSMIAGALGVLMFIWGFLKWLSIGNGNSKQKYAGFAFGMPTTAVIGLSLAAGLLALLGALDHRSGRGVPSAVPTALAGSSLLVALGILLGKGSISPDAGDKVGVQIGLILGLITAILQTGVLAMELASRQNDAANTGAPLGSQPPGGYGAPPQPQPQPQHQPQSQYAGQPHPGAYGPPQPPPGGYRAPQHQAGPGPQPQPGYPPPPPAGGTGFPQP